MTRVIEDLRLSRQQVERGKWGDSLDDKESFRLEDIEKRITEIYGLMSDRGWAMSIKESDRLIAMHGRVETPYTGSRRSDEYSLDTRTSISMTGWEIIDYTLNGLEVSFRKVLDHVKHTDLIIEYIELWAKRATLYQGMSMPAMSDFIKYDDYVATIYRDYQISKLATAPKVIPKSKPKSSLARSKVFGSMDAKEKIEAQRFSFLPYKSRIDLFPASVWMDQN